jgi:hypothetical protein
VFKRKQRAPAPVQTEPEEEIAYEDSWYRSLKARAERQAAASEAAAASDPEPEPTED